MFRIRELTSPDPRQTGNTFAGLGALSKTAKSRVLLDSVAVLKILAVIHALS